MEEFEVQTTFNEISVDPVLEEGGDVEDVQDTDDITE